MGLFASLFRRASRARTLNDLMTYDDHLLRDIGLSRTDLQSIRAGRRHHRVASGHE